MCLTKIYSIFFSYSTDKTESPCGNPRYTQCLKCFSYLLTAVTMAPSLHSFFNFIIGRGRSAGTSRGRIVALSLLGWEFFKAGSIPPVTLGVIGFIVSVFLKLFSFLARARLKDVCISVYHVWDKGDYRRLVVGPIVHADEWHLYYNMASLMWKGKILERR